MIGAAMPMVAADGIIPTPAVAMPISVTVTRKVYLRPSRSPRKPKSTAPKGRKPKPTANPAQTSRVSSVALSLGKKALPMIAASVP